MFPRRKRLSRSAFPLAVKNGQRISSEHLTVVIPKDAEGYAVVVSKKTARLSVTRHKIKRRALEALRRLPNSPRSVILYPRASILDVGYDELRQELIKILS